MSAKPIMFEDWMPDQSFWNQSILLDAKGVTPAAIGYHPMKSYVPTTSALTERCRGAMTFRKRTSARTMIAGDRVKLYKFNLGTQAFDDISDAGYNTEGSYGFWDFCQFNNLAIMTNLADPVKKYDIITSPATVSDLGGSPPQAMFAKTIGRHVVLAHLLNEENYVHWSAIDNAEGWTIGLNLSDKQDLPEGGRIMNFMGDIGDVGFLFQERGIKSMTKVPGSPLIFQIEVADPDRGCAAFRGLKQIGNVAFYKAHDGFMIFRNGVSTPIASELVEHWFYDNALGSQLSRLVCGIDPRNKIVFWSFVSKEYSLPNIDAGFGDKVLMYSWALKKWSRADLEVSAFVDVVDTPYTLDTINSFGDLDHLPASLDSPIWNGDNIATTMGMFGTDFKLGQLTGPNMEAIIELKNIQMFAPHRQYFRSCWPICDSPDLQIAVKAMEDIDTAGAYGAYASKETTGWIPIDSSARSHSIRQKIPAGSDWTHTHGIFPNASPDGEA